MRVIRQSSRQLGFTLTEVLVGLALSSLLMLGVVQLFVANSRSYSLLTGQSFMQESGRFAISVLARSGRMAGFKGCYSKNEEVYKTFLAAPPYEFNLTNNMIGYEGGLSAWQPNIHNVLPKTVGGIDSNIYAAGTIGPGNGIDTDKILRGTDIVTFNYIDSKKHRLAVGMVSSDELIELDDTAYDFGVDYMAYIHDCEKGTIFRVTGFDADLKIEHDGGADADGYTNAHTRLAEFNTYETNAYVSAIISDTYYIRESNGENKSGNKPMSLWRKRGVNKPVEIVQGIEDLQITYGVDTDNDDIPNRYLDANAVTNFSNVRTLRISVTAHSVDDVDGSTTPTHGCLGDGAGGRQFCWPGETVDGLLRRTFSQTLVLKN